jgi:hypothetical protein
MTANFLPGTQLYADDLNATFAHHVDCYGGDQMDGPLFLWDGDGSALSLDGTDYLQGACRGFVREQIQAAILNPPGNIVYLPLSGGTMTGPLTATAPLIVKSPLPSIIGNNSTITIDGPTGVDRTLGWHTNGSRRWQILIATTAETGANAAGDMYYNRFDDSGNYIGSPIWIRRSDGLVSIGYQARTVFGLDTATGSGSGLLINGAPGSQRSITWTTNYQAGGLAAGSRWFMWLSGNETGANVGADFQLRRYDDTGAYLSTPLTITRSTGLVTMSGGASITGATLTGGAFTGTFTGNHTYSGNVTVSGTLYPTSTGGMFIGDGVAGQGVAVSIQGAASSARQIRWYTGNASTPNQRMLIGMVNTESGSNAGANFSLSFYDDTGTFLNTPILITRSTGLVTMANGASITGGTLTGSFAGTPTFSGVVTFTSAGTGVGFSTNVRFSNQVGFNNTAPIVKPTVTGAKGSNAALASLMTALAAYGLVTDSTTA